MKHGITRRAALRAAGGSIALGAAGLGKAHGIAPALLAGSAIGAGHSAPHLHNHPPLGERPLPSFLHDLEHRTFRFFWERAHPANGLTPDRWPTPSFCSIAAVGFALTAYPLGVERGWITRSAARDRTLTTLKFLASLPMGDATSGVAGYRGFFYHFLSMETGLRHAQCELSTVDTALFHMGALFAAAWFDRDNQHERAIRRIAYDLVNRAEWDWFQKERTAISMGWHPEHGFIDRPWDGYNEGKLVYLLALGSKDHPARDDSWQAWCAPYDKFWRGEGATRRLAFAPLFGHQYTEGWVDFRGIYDEAMRAAGFDYFENSRRETLAHHAYCQRNPLGWDGYSATVWGLTACDGPGHHTLPHRGKAVTYQGYSARGPIDEPDGFDDGTMAPTAALGSLAFAPEICIPAGLGLHRRALADPRLYGDYGFKDAFNPSFRDTGIKPDNGSIDARHGWVGGDWLGIDQGPILIALANYRSDAVWRVMRRSPNLQRGLKRAGFRGGWLDRITP